MKDLAGKVAFITGGAAGLGLAMARSFSAAGMKIAIADIEDSALAAAKAEFTESNVEVITMKVDVTDREAMAQAREETLAAFDKVHVVCNNAGVALNGNIADMTYKDWDWVMKVNLDGVINGVVTFINDVKAHGEGGHFINTASIAGQFGMPTLGIYCASKFGVVGLSETMRTDLSDDNIGISVLCPGIVDTGIGKSERNRPNEYGGTKTPAMTQPDTGDDSTGAEMDSMSPEVIGEMVLHAVQNDVFYILSHREFKPMLDQRAAEIADSFDLWQEFRDKHNY